VRRQAPGEKAIGKLLVLLEVEGDGTRLLDVCILIGMSRVNGIFDFDGETFCLQLNIVVFVQSENACLDGDGYGTDEAFENKFR
jgi:hypothetical protein